jgi:hypothetical protein
MADPRAHPGSVAASPTPSCPNNCQTLVLLNLSTGCEVHARKSPVDRERQRRNMYLREIHTSLLMEVSHCRSLILSLTTRAPCQSLGILDPGWTGLHHFYRPSNGSLSCLQKSPFGNNERCNLDQSSTELFSGPLRSAKLTPGWPRFRPDRRNIPQHLRDIAAFVHCTLVYFSDHARRDSVLIEVFQCANSRKRPPLSPCWRDIRSTHVQDLRQGRSLYRSRCGGGLEMARTSP